MKSLGDRFLFLPYVKLLYNISDQLLGLFRQTLLSIGEEESHLLGRRLNLYFRGFYQLITKVRRARRLRSKKYIFRLLGDEEIPLIAVHSCRPN